MTEALSFSPVEMALSGVHVGMADFLQAKLAKVNKRLAKIGAPQATLTFGPIVEKQHKDEFGRTLHWQEYEVVTVTGVEAKFSGWTGVATLDHTLDPVEALVAKFPGQEDTVFPDEFRTRGPVCDHCHIAIARNLTVLFHHDDGRWMQVGTSCCKDFIGVDPATVLWLSTRPITEGDDEWEAAWGSCRREAAPFDFIAAASEATRLFGFVKSSYDCPTREEARTLCGLNGRFTDNDKKRFAEVDMARGEAEAVKVMAWVAESTDTSEFMTSARLACRTWHVTSKTEGLLACLPFVWQREMGKIAERQAKLTAKPEGHVGTVGQKLTVEGVVTFKMAFEPYHYYGPMSYRITVVTDDGFTVTTLGSGQTLSDCEVGDRIEMSGKVKELATSDKYGNQTVLKMAKVRVLASA